MSEANTALPFIMNIMKGVHTHTAYRDTNVNASIIKIIKILFYITNRIITVKYHNMIKHGNPEKNFKKKWERTDVHGLH